jgi:hypothetical protein
MMERRRWDEGTAMNDIDADLFFFFELNRKEKRKPSRATSLTLFKAARCP